MTGLNNGLSNAHVSRPLRAGVFAPIPTFFLGGSQDLDISTFQSHVLYLAKTGMGILLCGSMGEAHHLEPEERVTLIKAARQVLDNNGLTTVPIICGTGTGTTRQTIALTKEAAEAGADYSIVITSGYFAGALDYPAIKAFFLEVAEASPIPVMIYNYPGAAGGIDMDSDLIESIARESNNICGVKLTCGNVGKLVRIAAGTSVPSFAKNYPRKNPDAPFLVLGGFADFILPSSFSRAHGAIVGLGNVAPNALVRLTQLSFEAVTDLSVLPEAQRLQDVIARGDRTIALYGIAGTKFLLEKIHGYGGAPRRPLQRLTKDREEQLWAHENVQALLELERSCELLSAKNATVNGIPTPPQSVAGEWPTEVPVSA
ncbi:hypothetical protein FRB94_011771 [Tulasnella sp. JGI-2019a]|nr:hypothetical protein FRB93_002218 [Tulasnella sp. JGI-2019a]KAG9014593.1 hypothetical protein FRB94_011771 [Tulasnella sp. JGI-2019a]KAG9038928.1 hypothetical protein FRB95_013606 [Tulasnella sp. JGI-2019a]